MELNNQNSFGIGEGELIEIIYELPLPMRLDRWLVRNYLWIDGNQLKRYGIS